jgi:hypothetical protein
MLITTNVVEITSTEPMITGKSRLFNALFLFQSIPAKNIFNKTAPASMEANHPEIAVTTGFKEFLKHAFE